MEAATLERPEQERTISRTARRRGHTNGFRMMKAGPDGGDRHITWDPSDVDSVKEAEATFNEAVVAGPFNAYKVEMKPTRTGEPLTKFDPSMGEVIVGRMTDDEAANAHAATVEHSERTVTPAEVVLTPPMAGG